MKTLLVTVSLTATCALLVPSTARAAEITDTGTQRDGMHACPLGQALTGAHVDTNVFLCNTTAGTLGTETVDQPVYVLEWIWINSQQGGTAYPNWVMVSNGTQRDGMHACPLGSVVSGMEVNDNALLCAARESAPAGLEWVEIEDDGQTQRDGMHACPVGFVMTGIEVNQNRFLCGGFVAP